jgi:hypothetical protein
MGIPNEKALYSEEDIIYPREKGYRPKSDRASSFGKMLLNKAGAAIVSKLPDANEHSHIGQIYNSFKRGLRTNYNVTKHKHGIDAFKNDIPFLNKVVQNFWSFYHLNGGVSLIDYVYTVERGNKEYLLAYGTPKQAVDIPLLQQIAHEIQGRETSYVNSLIKSIPPDSEATNAGVFAELTDYDLYDTKTLRDISKFQPLYSKAELWFIGRKGKRDVIGQTATGENIVRYKKPSNLQFLQYYLEMDWVYTVMDKAIGAAERALGPGIAGQRVYEREVENVIKNTCRRYGEMREDGYRNPFASTSGIYMLV